MYTPDELTTIQAGLNEIIEGPAKVSTERVDAIRQATAAHGDKKRENFLATAVDHPQLFARICADPMADKFGYLGFLPKIAPLVYDSASEPQIRQAGESTRGLVIHLKHPDGEYVIKPYQSTDE